MVDAVATFPRIGQEPALALSERKVRLRRAYRWCNCASLGGCGVRLRRLDAGFAPARRAGRAFPHGLPALTDGPRDHHHLPPLSVLPAYGVATMSHGLSM